MTQLMVQVAGPVGAILHIDGTSYKSTAGVFTIPATALPQAQAAGFDPISTKIVAAAPTAADIPPGQSKVWKNTSDGTVKLYYNDAGTMKSVALA